MRQERQRANSSIMRDMAAEIFRELATLEREGSQALIRSMSDMVKPVPAEIEPIRGVEDLRALLAVFYPNGLSLLETHDAKMSEMLKKVRDSLTGAMAKPVVEQADAVKVERLMMVYEINQLLGALIKDLRAFMVEAVRPYVPSV